MRETAIERQYDSPFLDVVYAWQNRFLSPWSTHVASNDVLARTFDPISATLHTVRLQKKTRKSMPKWLPGRLAAIRDTWVLETSIIDVAGRTMYGVSRNIDHRINADGVEWQSLHEEASSQVSVHTTFSIVSATASGSAIGPWVQSQIEAAFVTGFRASAEKTRANFDFLLGVLRDPLLRPQFLYGLNGATFSRALPLAPSMSHAESVVAGFSGHGVRDAERDRYEHVDLRPPHRPWYSLAWRWREQHPDDTPARPSATEWARSRFHAAQDRLPRWFRHSGGE